MHRISKLYTGLCTLFIAIFALFSTAYALPGVTQYITDSSGEYVYYRDYTFNRESYAGYLYYNDGTYAARYYAPQDKTKQLPEKSVELLFTIDSQSDTVKMTGERILSVLTPDDNDIVNYLHDMMYELVSRRQKAGNIAPAGVATQKAFMDSGIQSEQDFAQFGGSVIILFDWNVPIFNLKRISGRDGKVLFETVTAGILTSSSDTSFSQFTGIPQKLLDSDHMFTRKTSDKPVEYSFPGTPEKNRSAQYITLDSGWKQSMENLWLLGDSAVLSVNILSVPQKGTELFFDRLARKMMLSAENSYAVWNRFDVQRTADRLSVSGMYYQNKEGNVTRDCKILTRINTTEYGYITLTVFDSIYENNRLYFDNILKSYSIR